MPIKSHPLTHTIKISERIFLNSPACRSKPETKSMYNFLKKKLCVIKVLNWKDKMATNSLLPWASWIGTYWFYDIRLVYSPLPVIVCPRCVGYTMIANQMAGLLGHPVIVCPRCVGYAGIQYHVPWPWIDFHIVKWYMNVSSACGQANVRS